MLNANTRGDIKTIALQYKNFTALLCTALHSSKMYCPKLPCTVPYCKEVTCNMLHCTTLYYTTLNSTALTYNCSTTLYYTWLLHCNGNGWQICQQYKFKSGMFSILKGNKKEPLCTMKPHQLSYSIVSIWFVIGF